MKTAPNPENSRDIVLVHSSDVHVDSRPLPVPGADGAAQLAGVIETARRVDADLILLAGDTFDSHRQPLELIERVAGLIAAASAPVVILPGNHDPIVPGCVYHRLGTEPVANLYVLGVTHDEALVFAGLDLEVWGRPHRDYVDMIPLERVRSRRTRWQIAMAHGHYQPQPDRSTRLRPSWLIGDEELAATQCDYIALGHWNRAASVGDGRVLAHYSGSPDYAESVNVVRLMPDGQVLVSVSPVLVGLPAIEVSSQS
jgi:DNA repair exonuclease SbcCD nuclease subunit